MIETSRIVYVTQRRQSVFRYCCVSPEDSCYNDQIVGLFFFKLSCFKCNRVFSLQPFSHSALSPPALALRIFFHQVHVSWAYCHRPSLSHQRFLRFQMQRSWSQIRCRGHIGSSGVRQLNDGDPSLYSKIKRSYYVSVCMTDLNETSTFWSTCWTLAPVRCF